MADVVIPEGCGLATLTWQMSGKLNPVTSTLGYVDINPGGPDPAVVALAWYNSWIDTGAYCDPDYMGTNWTFLGVDIVARVDGDLVGVHAGDPLQGESTVIAFPPINCCILARKTTSFVGRSKRGRMYLPNLLVAEGEIDNMGVIISGTVVVLNSLVGVAFDGMVGSNGQPAVLHSAALEDPTVISSMPVQSQMATQRRRMRS